jgi:hypothetical protein
MNIKNFRPNAAMEEEKRWDGMGWDGCDFGPLWFSKKF